MSKKVNSQTIKRTINVLKLTCTFFTHIIRHAQVTKIPSLETFAGG